MSDYYPALTNYKSVTCCDVSEGHYYSYTRFLPVSQIGFNFQIKFSFPKLLFSQTDSEVDVGVDCEECEDWNVKMLVAGG